MEVEMRGGEDVGLGQDVTPPLSPLSWALHDAFLHSHCASCFSPLPDSTVPCSSTLFYCSPICSSSDSPLHFSSAEFHLLQLYPFPSSDLRAALRLLRAAYQRRVGGRLAGLLTNRHKLIASADDDDMLVRIRQEARAMAAARRLRDGKDNLKNDDVLFEEEEASLCTVITNAVEVQDNEGRNLGIAVYDINFSWINHGCSPNACYRFLISPPSTTPSFPADDGRSRIVPACSNGQKTEFSQGLQFSDREGYGNYGPRIVVRSIKKINKNEEITIAYTDLLQPKTIRQSDLWSKYRFICCCTRCNASPLSYVDRLLQEISASNLASSSSSSDHSLCRDEATKNLIDYVDEVITEYLSSSDPESCCNKLESILIHGFLNAPLETEGGKSQLKIRLHPLHHLALNVYTTLASAHRIRASDILALDSATDRHQLEVFDMHRISAAYSFLLAAATYQLFCFESSLIASVSNFWTNAGESLLILARNSIWDSFELELRGPKRLTLSKHNCSKCSYMNIFEANLSLGQCPNEDFENISGKFLYCITGISKEVWTNLTQGCHSLKMFKDPLDFGLHGNLSDVSDFEVNLVRNNMDSYCWTEKSMSGFEAKFSNQDRIHIFQLGVHCLLYGEFLATICYDKDSHRTRHIHSLLHHEEK